jgi:integrator complex subunit 3
LNDKELHDLLTTLVSKDNKQHEEISIGLLYIILTDSQQAQKTYRDLTLIARDGLAIVVSSLIQLIAEKYQKISELSKRQLLWLLRELVKNQVPGIDNIVWNLLRQATGGDVSPRNIQLIEGMLEIFMEHRAWIEKNPFMIMTICYTFVRLIEDHNAPHLLALRNKEVKFVVALIRDRFVEVIPLGREFVRLLQNVARLPEFDLLWRDILLNPKSLHPTFTGIWQLLQMRTSRKFLAARLTPEIERKLIFLTNNVKFGNHKRYQDWFQDRYFTTQESQSLRSDLIRYIITAIHPTNDMLCSDIMPRWAIIGWLLTSCTNQTALANAKLAVFYDWLFFDPNKDNIMNVEPGILVMYHSIKNHPMVSSTLLDFLCRITKNFYPKGEDRIRAGVYNSLRKILEKQVIPSIGPLFESPKLDVSLKQMIRENFREFCVSTVPDIPFNFIAAEESKPLIPVPFNVQPLGTTGIQSTLNLNMGLNSSGELDGEAKFSDDEEDVKKPIKLEDEDDDDDDLPLSKVRLKEKTTDKVDLPAQIRDSFDEFVESKSVEDFEEFLGDFKSGCSLNEEQEQYVHENVVSICKSQLPEKWIHPDEDIEDKLEETINYPIYSLFKILYQSEEKCKKCVLELIDYVRENVPSAGYMLLYFLKSYAKLQTKGNLFKKNCYEIFHENCDVDLAECIVDDLTKLEQFNSQMFLWLVPDMYREFKNDLVNNSDVLKIVVSCIDAKNLKDLIYNVSQGKLVLFENDSVAEVVRSSLTYETFEQFCLWQLIQAHSVPFDSLKVSTAV